MTCDKEPLDIIRPQLHQEYIQSGSGLPNLDLRRETWHSLRDNVLSWHTKLPLQYHQRMAHHLVQYLFNTREMPMILGGGPSIINHVKKDSQLHLFLMPHLALCLRARVTYLIWWKWITYPLLYHESKKATTNGLASLLSSLSCFGRPAATARKHVVRVSSLVL